MKIMILTSYYTGYGHASITSALEDVLRQRGIDFRTLEMFDLCGGFIKARGKSYGKVTRTKPGLWKFAYNFSDKHPKFINFWMRRSCQKKFLAEFADYQPDIVMTIHAMFNGSILNIIAKHQLKCRFATVIADLVSINSMWVDPRADLIVCPSRECCAYALKRGVDIDRLAVINLPTRSLINDTARTIQSPELRSPNSKKTSFLLMSGGEGSGDMAGTVEKLLQIDGARVTVIAGRNQELANQLTDKFADCGRVTVHGFVDNINEILPAHDIAVVRGSPNVLMECFALNVPVIITDALPGQEMGNIDFTLTHQLGLYCPDRARLLSTVNRYLADGKRLLRETKERQFAFRDLDAAAKIIDTVTSDM